jgi:hypothetical protein
MITINLTSATHIALLINILVHLGKWPEAMPSQSYPPCQYPLL